MEFHSYQHKGGDIRLIILSDEEGGGNSFDLCLSIPTSAAKTTSITKATIEIRKEKTKKQI